MQKKTSFEIDFNKLTDLSNKFAKKYGGFCFIAGLDPKDPRKENLINCLSAHDVPKSTVLYAVAKALDAGPQEFLFSYFINERNSKISVIEKKVNGKSVKHA